MPRVLISSAFLSCFILSVLTLSCKVKPAQEQEPTPPMYGWVALSSNHNSVVRAVTQPGASAPQLKVDGSDMIMTRRSSHRPAHFPVDVWEATLPAGAQDLVMDERRLSTPDKDPKRIIVFGDTGCRIKKKHKQNCNGRGEGDKWAFAELAEIAASTDPDLVIHVGDYLYREYPCDGDPGCEGSPYGDTFDSWRADFLEPAGRLLQDYPWVFTRGNHEDCERGRRGWFYMLDPLPLPTAGLNPCRTYTEPYTITLGNRSLIVMDNAEVPYETTPHERKRVVAEFAEQFKRVNRMAIEESQPSWLIAHRPLWSIVGFYNSEDMFQFSVNDTILQDALAKGPGKLDPSIEMLVGGHLHLFESLHFRDGRPPQFVSGGGGTKLDPEYSRATLEDQTDLFEQLQLDPADFRSDHNFNFLLLDKQDKGWTMRVFGLEGQIGEAIPIPAESRACIAHQDTSQLLTQPFLSAQPISHRVTCDNPVEAMQVRDRFVADLTAELGQPVGYKAALTSPPAQAKFGVKEPLWGVLLADMIYPNGASLPVNFGSHGLFEGDLIVRIGDNSINEAATREEAARAIESVHPFLELPDMVYETGMVLDGPAITAVNTGARAGILGQGVVLKHNPVSTLAKVHVEILDADGRVVSSGRAANLMGHPLDALLWIRDAVKASGRRLEPGTLVSLGSLTAPKPVVKPGAVTARYFGLGPQPIDVRVVFTP